jgi:hypothetical protein
LPPSCEPGPVSAAIRERGSRSGVMLSAGQQRKIADQAAAALGTALIDHVLPPQPAAPEPRPAPPRARVTPGQVHAQAALVLKYGRAALRLKAAAIEAVVASLSPTGREMADEVIRPVLEHLLDRLGTTVLKLAFALAARHGGQSVVDADVHARDALALQAVLGRPANPGDAMASFAAGVDKVEQGHKDKLGSRLDELIKERGGEAKADRG